MLYKDRFDFFPRSIVEIWDELEVRPEYNLVVENTLLLRYPAAMYYFVNRDNNELATDIENGLNLSIKDGSFEKMFLEYNFWLIQRAKLAERKTLFLNNPLIPPLTPLNDADLWYDPI